jgi:hypothetical protein
MMLLPDVGGRRDLLDQGWPQPALVVSEPFLTFSRPLLVLRWRNANLRLIEVETRCLLWGFDYWLLLLESRSHVVRLSTANLCQVLIVWDGHQRVHVPAPAKRQGSPSLSGALIEKRYSVDGISSCNYLPLLLWSCPSCVGSCGSV